MLKKLFLFLLILCTAFVVSVFLFPDKIEAILGSSQLTQSLHQLRDSFHDSITDVPSLKEVKDTYAQFYSGAVDATDTWKNGVTSTKEVIDDVRKTLSGAEDIYNKTRDGIESAKDTLENVGNQIEQIGQTIDTFQQ